MENLDELLKLENQLCFPLYAASKEVIRRYKPFLDELDITYTQYIVLLALWEKDDILVKELGEQLYLDSGTLTPLLNKLEKKHYIKKTKGKIDQREIFISLTQEGRNLKGKAYEIPLKLGKCVKIDEEDTLKLKRILSQILEGFKNE